MVRLACTEFGENLCRDIEVSGLHEDQVSKGVEGAESPGAIFHHADDAAEAFGNGWAISGTTTSSSPQQLRSEAGVRCSK